VGIWKSLEFSNMQRLFGATNLTLAVYSVAWAFTNSHGQGPFASLEADLKGDTPAGNRVLARCSGDLPHVILEGSKLLFGTPMEGFSVEFSFQDEMLLLQDSYTNNGFSSYLNARLKRVSRLSNNG